MQSLWWVIHENITFIKTRLFNQINRNTELFEEAGKKLFRPEIDRIIVTTSLARKINK